MNDAALYSGALLLLFLLIPLVTLGALKIDAPYGRHARAGWGPSLGSRLGWVLMESPSALLFPLIVALGERSQRAAVWVIAALWIAHYIERTFHYPFKQRGQQDKRVPLAVIAMGFSFNVLNSYLNGRSLGTYGPDYDSSWLLAPRFISGAILFALGYTINRWADSALRRLRTPGQSGYRIPRGGLYELISCPNYFGELIQWIGWAIATWSLAGLGFAAFTAANLLPRALAHHAWYAREFEDYPKQRRAIVPFLL